MKSYIQITIRTFTIWIMASIINGLLTGTYLFFNQKYDAWLFVVLFITIMSLVLAVPGFFVFWIVMIIKIGKGVYNRTLFRTALSTGFILSVITSFAFSGLFTSVYTSQKYIIMLLIILSAMWSIILHFKQFKKITN